MKSGVMVAAMALLCLSNPVAALTVEEKCDSIAEVAYSVMEGRQAGKARAAIVAAVQVDGWPEITQLFEIMVQEAFESSSATSARAKQQQSAAFAQFWRTECLQELAMP